MQHDTQKLKKDQNTQDAVKQQAGYDVAAFRPISAHDNLVTNG
jgi:hypothetical protein